MKISKLLIHYSTNGRAYPSLFIRAIISVIIGLFVLNFDYIRTGKSITDGNYWAAKGIECFAVYLVFEYIFRTHLWCTKIIRVNRHLLRLFLLQFILGVALPQLFIWQVLTKLFGITYLSYWESMGYPPQKGSVAMIFETLMIFNGIILLCYLDIRGSIRGSYKSKHDIGVYYLGKTQRINNDEILCIIPFKEINFLVTRYMGIRILFDHGKITEVFKTLPTDKFELRENGIFDKSINDEQEKAFLNYIKESYHHTLLSNR